MEYITTYGWAILVILIIGVVVWQMGWFDINSKFQPGFSGFSILVPQDWKVANAETCTLSVRFLNAAGESLENVTVSGGSACNPADMETGEYTLCTKDLGTCGSDGSGYNENLIVTYIRAADGQEFQTAGTLWGNSE